ncbi:hypothetical protein L7H23_12035 [Sphingopyxis sp. BSN-002]|uniref:hypothetical protein n=1 Tax=Sphingopyxis sp. BSN-002 TaxID=2911495 RepID=UPI001EDA11EA|nr:hypothetical protein [Sphingopyxis sp. BSN-002]UKK83292.1 hypothetical protein L7H23_12035 [Sphingopyxis sp. BSN-002]
MPPRHLPLLALALALAACGTKADKAAAEAPKAEASKTAPTGNPPDASGTKAGAAETSPLPPTAGTKLAAYVGKYPFDKVDGVAWNDHVLVKAGIVASVKDAAVLKAITTTEGPSAPIEMKDGKVMAWACEAHNCGSHQWSVLIDPRTGATDVCYFDDSADNARSRWFLASGKEEKREGNCQ